MTQKHKVAQPAAPAIHGIRKTHKSEAQIFRFLIGFLRYSAQNSAEGITNPAASEQLIDSVDLTAS